MANQTERTIKEQTIDLGRKKFAIALKENHNGKFLRVTEDTVHRRNTVIIPAEGLAEFLNAIDVVIEGQNL